MAHDTPTSLAAALAEVSRAHADLGLEVRQQYDELPDDLPPEVVEAIAHAVREALNNVVKHAGLRDAWVTATGDEAGRCASRSPTAGLASIRGKHGGFGINQSIRGRMKAAGGRGQRPQLGWARDRGRDRVAREQRMIRVGVVDDDAMLREGMGAWFSSMPDLRIVASAGSLAELLAEPPALDVVLLDLNLRDFSNPAANVRLWCHAAIAS